MIEIKLNEILENFQHRCIGCGQCCVRNTVVLAPFDIFNISRLLKCAAKELFEKKIVTYTINSATYFMEPVIVNRLPDKVCPFLIKSGKIFRCGIYKHRPLVCRISPLVYNYNDNFFYRREVVENRCSPDVKKKPIRLGRYLRNNRVKNSLADFRKYKQFLEYIITSGYNINGIKNIPEKKKIFFRIQALLYETYPGNEEIHSSYPFDLVKKQIIGLIEKDK